MGRIKTYFQRGGFAATAFVLGLALGIAPSAGLLNQPQPPPVSTVVADGPHTLGGCIRLYATGPEWHVDNDHWIEGIDPSVDPVIDSSGFLTFHTIEKNAIVAIQPSPDETLVARGISVGGSNGSYLVRLRFYKAGVGPLDLTKKEHLAYITGKVTNIWVTLTQNGTWEEA